MPGGAAPAKQQPRRRILQAALELAATGGYEALQVRAISERAGVSSRTIYANFQSLDALLIVAVAEQSQALYQSVTDAPPRGRTPAARVHRLITDLTATMTANRELTLALLRSLLSGKRDVSQYVHGFGGVLQAMLASAIAPAGPTARDREVAELLEGIWFAALVGWASGTSSDADIGRIMQRAARLLLPAS
jgi:TetR/AcrR family transcriptional regulator, cholesterol catabolism regulator